MTNIKLTETKQHADTMLKYLIKASDTYEFKLYGAKIKVLFATQSDAPTLENALVKIARRRVI